MHVVYFIANNLFPINPKPDKLNANSYNAMSIGVLSEHDHILVRILIIISSILLSLISDVAKLHLIAQ